jgi:WD40 repeat protein
MVVAVLLLMMVATDLSPLGTGSMVGPGPRAIAAREVGPRAQPNLMNDPSTGTVGAPSYYASFLSIAGFGTPIGRRHELLPIDIDGDGTPELATMTAQAFLEVLDPPSYKVIWRSQQLPSGAHALTSGDLDNDGHPELVAGDGQGDVHVYSIANIQDPTRPPMAIGRLNASLMIRALAVVDYDNDGRPDIICAPDNKPNLTYLRNSLAPDGKGIRLTEAFSMDLTILVASYFRVEVLRVADLNGSGDARVIVGLDDPNHDDITILELNKHTLHMENYGTDHGTLLSDLVVQDLDNDSYKEIIINKYSGIDVLNGTTLGPKWGLYSSGIYFLGFDARDFNGNGTTQLLTFEETFSPSKIYVAFYNGTSGSREFKEFLGWKETLVGIASGDLDMDHGVPEVAVTTMGNMTIMRIVPSLGHNYTINKVVQNVGYEAYGLDGFDWNGDGITELVSGSNEGLLSVMDPRTGDILAQRSCLPYSQASVIIADLDKDGKQEILTGNLHNVTALANNLTVKAYVSLDGYRGSTWTPGTRAPMTVADLDRDGSPEVLVGTEAPSVEVLNGKNLSINDSYWGNQGMLRTMITADLSGDGHAEVVTGDTMGYVTIITGPQAHLVRSAFYNFGPYGLATADVNDDGRPEILVGDYIGYIRALDAGNLTPVLSSNDLGAQIWGITIADVDGDGRQEVVVGTGDGMVLALNMTDLSVKWKAHLGEWIGPYDSLLVKDLDNDGHLEIAVGSDGYVYVLRLSLPSEKPDISFGAISVPGTVEDGREVNISVPVTVIGPVPGLNVTVDFSIEPTGPNVTGGQDLGRVSGWMVKGTHTVSLSWVAVAGTWRVVAAVDPDNNYSERDEWNNRAELILTVTARFARMKWFAGQGTGLGRYSGMVMADTNYDGRSEVLVGATEGFVQSYAVKKTTDGSGLKDMSAMNVTDDLGSNPYGITVADVDRDGNREVVVSTGEGWVYSFKGVGERLEWKDHVTNSPCYGISAGDIDSDGTVEVVVGCSNSRLYVLDGRDGRLKEQALLLFELYAIDIADIGNDGKPDLVVGAQDGTVYVLDARTLATEQSLVVGDASIDDVKAGDIDHDGRSEIVYGDRIGHVFVLGTVPNTTSALGWDLNLRTSMSTGSAVKGVDMVDMSKDPGLELLVGSNDGIRAYRARNGNLEKIGNITVDGGLTGMTSGDVDMDGAIEVSVGTLSGNLTLLGIVASYIGNSTGITFTKEAFLPGLGAGLYGTAYGDLDGDGAPEIVLGTDSGELRVYDGISKELEAHITGLGASLYGLEVADVNDDGSPELVVGSGNKTVCALRYGEGSLIRLWCSDNLGDWTTAFEVLDLNRDGRHEVVVGSGSRVYVLNGTTGKVMMVSANLGLHIISLATGKLDGNVWRDIVVGTEEGNLSVLNGNNLSLAWCVTLDSWPVGLAIADTDGDGLGTIYAGTNSAVYAISFKDREVEWKDDLGQNAWGVVVADFESDGRFEVFTGLKDGRVMALNASTGRPFWTSTYLGSRAGWYNSLKVGDVDMDSQRELIVGSSGFLYLLGAGFVPARPMADAVLENVRLQEPVLADGQRTNLTATVYDHSLAVMVNLTVHLFVDDVFMDSTVIHYLDPLGRVTVAFPYTARVGEHNLSVYVDKYDAVHEYNEDNNDMTIKVYVLGSVNLAIDGGVKGIRFSAPLVKGVPVTVFADIRNTGEEASGGQVKFYWANLRLFGEATVHVRGQEKVTAAVNWTPPEAGTWDIRVIIEPDGFDSSSGDNTAAKVVHVMTHPSVALASVHFPGVIVEEMEYLVPVNVTNRGEAGTTGELMLYIDGRLGWRSGLFMVPGGSTILQARFNATAGAHAVRLALENVTLDDRTTDNALSFNITVRTRPDMLFDTVTTPTENLLVPGRQLFIALLVANRGGSNGTCVIRGYDNDAIFFERTLSIAAGRSTTVQVPWNATKGDHALVFRIEGTVPGEFRTGDNMANVNIFVPENKGGGLNWPMISVLVIGILAPVIAVLFYYAQVQPVREAARQAAVPPRRPVKKAVKKVKKKGV